MDGAPWLNVVPAGCNMVNYYGAAMLTKDGLKLFCASPPNPPTPFLIGENLLCSPSVWLKLQPLVLKLPQNLLCPPSACLKLFPNPLLVRVKLHMPPLLLYCSPPPLPVISDQSLKHCFLSPKYQSYCQSGGREFVCFGLF